MPILNLISIRGDPKLIYGDPQVPTLLKNAVLEERSSISHRQTPQPHHTTQEQARKAEHSRLHPTQFHSPLPPRTPARVNLDHSHLRAEHDRSPPEARAREHQIGIRSTVMQRRTGILTCAKMCMSQEMQGKSSSPPSQETNTMTPAAHHRLAPGKSFRPHPRLPKRGRRRNKHPSRS